MIRDSDMFCTHFTYSRGFHWRKRLRNGGDPSCYIQLDERFEININLCDSTPFPAGLMDVHLKIIKY